MQRAIALLLAFWLLVPAPLMAQNITPETAIERLFTAPQLQSEWFAPMFLEQIPVSQLEKILTSLQTELGEYEAVQKSGKNYLVVFQRGSVPAQIILDSSGRITRLLFQNPRLSVTNLNEIVEKFKALPGQVSLLVLENSKERAALNADKPLAVGSAFKLAVLKVLKEHIESAKRSWSDVVELQPRWQSLSSGILQDWPAGSPLTIHTLAALMISQSDNTATDALIHLVSRQAVEAIAPRNRPFLTTRETFILKVSKNQELLQRYRAGDETKRRAVLQQASRYPLPEVGELSNKPAALDVEWFFTTRELCSLISTVAELPLMSINPGVANPNDWQHVAFKGGSEPGGLNLTTWLQAKNGKKYCIAATWNNDAPLDETRFRILYSSAIANLE